MGKLEDTITDNILCICYNNVVKTAMDNKYWESEQSTMKIGIL